MAPTRYERVRDLQMEAVLQGGEADTSFDAANAYLQAEAAPDDPDQSVSYMASSPLQRAARWREGLARIRTAEDPDQDLSLGNASIAGFAAAGDYPSDDLDAEGMDPRVMRAMGLNADGSQPAPGGAGAEEDADAESELQGEMTADPAGEDYGATGVAEAGLSEEDMMGMSKRQRDVYTAAGIVMPDKKLSGLFGSGAFTKTVSGRTSVQWPDGRYIRDDGERIFMTADVLPKTPDRVAHATVQMAVRKGWGNIAFQGSQQLGDSLWLEGQRWGIEVGGPTFNPSQKALEQLEGYLKSAGPPTEEERMGISDERLRELAKFNNLASAVDGYSKPWEDEASAGAPTADPTVDGEDPQPMTADPELDDADMDGAGVDMGAGGQTPPGQDRDQVTEIPGQRGRGGANVSPAASDLAEAVSTTIGKRRRRRTGSSDGALDDGYDGEEGAFDTGEPTDQQDFRLDLGDPGASDWGNVEPEEMEQEWVPEPPQDTLTPDLDHLGIGEPIIDNSRDDQPGYRPRM